MTKHGQLLKSQYGFLLPTAFNVTKNRLIYAIPFFNLSLSLSPPCTRFPAISGNQSAGGQPGAGGTP
ncbi:hypothetical protein LX87_01904 [Larkinella arboricola]|uniref:Uncharacterized protein n=1 Tax=Larkinella arboricola TaxID=643671 RepID=A0A327X1D8_LARAB|nr:hypothetical protein [Larkinella arboricola]RAK00206.1 hypothetical protein LX87_01904 [Larkinella arboricola]